MAQEKEAQTAVSWRIKNSTLEWLRAKAREQDRPVNWVLNRLLEQEKAKDGVAA